MDVMLRGKSLIGAVFVLIGVGLALSGCAVSGPEGAYANGYYEYPDYGLDSFGFVVRDRDHHRRHDHDHDRDDGNRYGMRDGDYARTGTTGMGIAHGPSVVTGPPPTPPVGLGSGHSFGGGRSGGGRR